MMTIYIYITRTSTFKSDLTLKVPFLFDNGEVQNPWIPGIPCFIALHFIALHRCCVFYKLKTGPFYQQKDYDSLYCADLESNPQYLRGMPVVSWEFVVFYDHH